ncbi:malate synthase A [Granulicoccus phenolivorans]|uniref:malate synthase A n=1 Tax=Granulicoccus phenolivorans TaxID=266854 RepID=UPI0003F83B87|nr:malate synthase A [Granulicoccus phenolivorans]
MNSRIEINGAPVEGQERILTPEALDFLVELHDIAAGRRAELLQARQELRDKIGAGFNPTFLEETKHIREDDSWRVAPIGPGLADRRVEITGPTDKKMTINALNSGAKVWLADQEDANTPNWQNVIGGQVSLYDANRDQIEYTSPEGKEYRLQVPYEQTPTIVMRPRGWHLEEKHITVDGERMSGGVVDFGLYFFHNAEHLLSVGRGPYFYLPKTESYLEARLWNDLFNHAEQKFGIPGTIRATVLIETITASFQLEEIIYELRDHMGGLNAGRWDYIFSIIKNFRLRGEEFVLPDRKQVTMTTPFMRSYTEQLVRACHRRGVHAIGGMAAFIPNRRDPQVTEKALAAVHEDKKREANDGFDGSWVAHPDLVPICREEFDAVLGDKPNQIDRLREDVVPDDKSLIDLKIEGGQITEAGVRTNVEVGIRYLEAWLRGNGAAGINNLMEDVATAEISRSQIWQWIHCGSKTAEGQTVTRDWIEQLIEEEFTKLPRTEGDKFDNARKLFEEVALADEYPAFLTIPGYDHYLEN